MIAPPAALYIGLPQPCATRRGLACCNPPACLTTLILLLNVRASLRRLYRSEVLPRADAERADSGRLVSLWSRSAVRHRWATTVKGEFAMKLLTCAAVLTLAVCSSYAFAQAPMGHPGANMSDEELIKLAISAAPEAVTKDATVIMVGSDGKTRTLRQGGGQWTCMPGHADAANPDPMCGDLNAMEWAAAWMGHKAPPPNKVGFMYMLRGDGGASNTDPY